MHIHKPKAAHSLREFLAEISVIVVGIAIALTGEQAVERFDWSRKVAEARDGLSVELGENLGQAEDRVRTEPCVERRLDELAAVVDEAARTGWLPPLGESARPDYFTWDTGVWRSAVSAQTADHMGRQELKAYTETYEYVAQIGALTQHEDQLWTVLFGLAGPGRRFDPAEAAAFRRAISDERYTVRLIGLGGLRARQMVEAWRLPYDQRTFHSFADISPAGPAVAICKPIDGHPPAHYGAAPFEGALDFVRAHPITVDDNGLGQRR